MLVSGGERRNRLIAAGYNGFLPGTPHVSRQRDGHEQATVHAEQNAVADAARRGSSVEGAVAYVTHFPCINCAKILASAGIAEVRYRHNYNNDPLVAPLKALGEPMFLMDSNPTVERIARLIFDYAASQGLAVVRVKVWETPTSFAEFGDH